MPKNKFQDAVFTIIMATIMEPKTRLCVSGTALHVELHSQGVCNVRRHELMDIAF